MRIRNYVINFVPAHNIPTLEQLLSATSETFCARFERAGREQRAANYPQQRALLSACREGTPAQAAAPATSSL
jgi:DNA-binding FadR family transcriptional regulator